MVHGRFSLYEANHDEQIFEVPYTRYQAYCFSLIAGFVERGHKPLNLNNVVLVLGYNLSGMDVSPITKRGPRNLPLELGYHATPDYFFEMMTLA